MCMHTHTHTGTQRVLYIATSKHIFYFFIMYYRKLYDSIDTYMSMYTYAFFAGNQLINCRNHILEFKEKILRLKNKTERNRQELINALSKMKYEMTQRENTSTDLGLCYFCFCVSWFVCWFCVLCLEI